MPNLVEIDRDTAVRRIADASGRVRGVAAAFLFGSALGTCRPDSDVDVAIIRAPADDEDPQAAFKADLRLESDFLQTLDRVDGHPVDVTVLDEAHPIFAMTVLRGGRICCICDEVAYTDFLEHVAQAYRENAPRYEAALREVLEEPVGGHGD